MQQTILDQQQKIEELRIKLSYYQSGSNENTTFSVKSASDEIVHLLDMSRNQYEFIKEKFLLALDYDSNDSEALPDGNMTCNLRHLKAGKKKCLDQ